MRKDKENVDGYCGRKSPKAGLQAGEVEIVAETDDYIDIQMKSTWEDKDGNPIETHEGTEYVVYADGTRRAICTMCGAMPGQPHRGCILR